MQFKMQYLNTQHIMQPININLKDNPNFLPLIQNRFYFAFCTQGFNLQQSYTALSNLIINDNGILYFFDFADSFQKQDETL